MQCYRSGVGEDGGVGVAQVLAGAGMSARATITVQRLAQLSGVNYYVLRNMLRRYGLTWRGRRDRRGRLRVSYAELARVAPDLTHVVELLIPAVQKRVGRPRGYKPHYAKPGPKPK